MLNKTMMLTEARGEQLAGKLTRYFVRKIKNKDWEEIYRPLEEYNDGKPMPSRWIEYKDSDILCNLYIFPEEYFEKQNDELIDIYAAYFLEDGYLPTQKKGSIEIIVELDKLTNQNIEFFVKRLKTVLIHEINHKYQEEQDIEFNDYDLKNIYLTSRRLYNFLSKSENLDRVSEEDIEHFAYHLNENEIDSVVRELYAQAKRDKKPYIEVLRQYIRKMYSYDKEHIQENEIKDVYWVFYKELYRNMIKHAKKYLPSAQLKENNEKMNLKKIIKEEVEKSIREARPYLGFYGGKNTWIDSINFMEKYEDFYDFLEETKNKKISAEWVEAGSAGELSKVMTAMGIPNQASYNISQVVHDIKDWWNKSFKVLRKVPFIKRLFLKYITNKRKSPLELYKIYEEAKKKPIAAIRHHRGAQDKFLQGLQFILEYEYERWKAEKEKPDEQR